MAQEIDLWRGFPMMASWRDLEDRMDRLFDTTVGRPWRRTAPIDDGWLPALELFERDNSLVVRADLPGMKREMITVAITDHTLTISGERKAETEVKEKDYYRCERSYGSFKRAITLPAGVDATKIAATYKDGVLEVTMPKAKGHEAKTIPIQ